VHLVLFVELFPVELLFEEEPPFPNIVTVEDPVEDEDPVPLPVILIVPLPELVPEPLLFPKPTTVAPFVIVPTVPFPFN